MSETVGHPLLAPSEAPGSSLAARLADMAQGWAHDGALGALKTAAAVRIGRQLVHSDPQFFEELLKTASKGRAISTAAREYAEELAKAMKGDKPGAVTSELLAKLRAGTSAGVPKPPGSVAVAPAKPPMPGTVNVTGGTLAPAHPEAMADVSRMAKMMEDWAVKLERAGDTRNPAVLRDLAQRSMKGEFGADVVKRNLEVMPQTMGARLKELTMSGRPVAAKPGAVQTPGVGTSHVPVHEALAGTYAATPSAAKLVAKEPAKKVSTEAAERAAQRQAEIAKALEAEEASAAKSIAATPRAKAPAASTEGVVRPPTSMPAPHIQTAAPPAGGAVAPAATAPTGQGVVPAAIAAGGGGVAAGTTTGMLASRRQQPQPRPVVAPARMGHIPVGPGGLPSVAWGRQQIAKAGSVAPKTKEAGIGGAILKGTGKLLAAPTRAAAGGAKLLGAGKAGQIAAGTVAGVGTAATVGGGLVGTVKGVQYAQKRHQQFQHQPYRWGRGAHQPYWRASQM